MRSGIKISNYYQNMRRKTISTKVIEIDIMKEPSVMIKFGDRFGVNLFTIYPNNKGQRQKRQRDRRIGHGQCSYFGCPNRAEKGFRMCRDHRKLDSAKGCLRMRRNRAK